MPEMNGCQSTILGALRDLDYRVSFWLFRCNSGPVGVAAKMLSAAGSERIFVPFAAGAAAAALFEGQFVGAAALAFVTMLTRIGISVLKTKMLRSRPVVSELSSNSFPSGHTIAGGVVYGTAAFVLTHSDWSLMNAITVCSGLLAAAIGTARVIRGFHWITDAAAGVVLGVVFLITVCLLISYM